MRTMLLLLLLLLILDYCYKLLEADTWLLTPSTAAVPNCCCSKDSAPYWSNPAFLIIWHSGAQRQSARMSNN